MREVGDGFSEEGTELRIQDREKLVTWCTGETAAAPAVWDPRRETRARQGWGWRQDAGREQGSRPEARGVSGCKKECIFYTMRIP